MNNSSFCSKNKEKDKKLNEQFNTTCGKNSFWLEKSYCDFIREYKMCVKSHRSKHKY